MKQNEFILKVQHVNDIEDIDVQMSCLSYNYNIVMTAFEVDGVFVINKNIIKLLYPQIEKVGFKDVMEGVMGYSGPLSIDEIKSLLNEWGFVISESKKHNDLISGIEVKCKIRPLYELRKTELEDKIIELNKRLDICIENENFEEAAKIRDEVKNLKKD